MTLTTETRAEIVSKFKIHEKDTGSPDVQIALLTERIVTLTEHFKKHHKDFLGRRGLLGLVSRRRRLLDYVKRKNNKRYLELLAELKLRR